MNSRGSKANAGKGDQDFFYSYYPFHIILMGGYQNSSLYVAVKNYKHVLT